MSYLWMDAAEIAQACGDGKHRKLSKSRRGEERWITRCPAHNDGRPSCVVIDGEKTTLFWCYAGCSSRDVSDALYARGIRAKRFVPYDPKDHADVVHAPRRADGKTPTKVAAPDDKGEWAGCGLPKRPSAAEVHIPKGYAYSNSWPWHTEAGEIIMYTYRFDEIDGPGKTYSPMSVWQKNGKKRWTNMAVPPLRPLYDLHKSKGSGPVLVAEGEKTVDTARLILPQFEWHTTAGSSTSFSHVDYTPLAGRDVVFAVDMDGQGLSAAGALADLSLASSVTALLLPKRIFPTIDIGGDLVDLWLTGLRSEGLMEIIRDNKESMLVKLS